MLTNTEYLYPKGHNCKMLLNRMHLNSHGVSIYACVSTCGCAYASLCLPFCLCVQEREGEQYGLQGTLCINR